MAQYHFQTPPDPEMAHKNPKMTHRNLKMTQKSWLGSRWDNFNMSLYRAVWTHFRSNCINFEQMKIPKFIYLNFQISGKFVRIGREGIFLKVVRLEKLCRTV